MRMGDITPSITGCFAIYLHLYQSICNAQQIALGTLTLITRLEGTMITDHKPGQCRFCYILSSSSPSPMSSSQNPSITLDTLSKSILASSTTAFFYYCVTHFDDEVEYIWSRKRTAGKIMYLITRYLGALFLVFLNLSMINVRWNPVGVDSFSSSGNVVYNAIEAFYFTVIGSILMILAEVILQMRIYAIYGRSKWVLVGLIFMNIVSLALCALQALGILAIGSLLIVPCFQSSLICGPISLKRDNGFTQVTSKYWPSSTNMMSPITWLVTTIEELILFILVVRKANYRIWYPFRARSILKTPDIISNMARDSTVYFATVFTLGALGTVLSFLVEVKDPYLKFGGSDKYLGPYFYDFLFSQLADYQISKLERSTLVLCF
ncbi:hypothetical protein PNOK_0639300 [Pyrrhoderma noxium]|uniref:DUF6533 domain-containing protein n=1 Tax=Pyrrhoderma noxium TaxID=2282107 RepID=A0A286UEB4_9AGAM|nr:hypothetical protein PNOK_0639300 [Pyrrhoderma noxium]